jgi:hypothetical protein
MQQLSINDHGTRFCNSNERISRKPQQRAQAPERRIRVTALQSADWLLPFFLFDSVLLHLSEDWLTAPL